MRLHVFSLLYSSTRMFEQSLEQRRLTSSVPDFETTRWVLNNLYPFEMEENRERLRALSVDYGLTCFEPVEGRNIGLHQGLNRLCEIAELRDDDIFAIVDPDGFPLNQGWDKALHDVLMADETLGYAALLPAGQSPTERARNPGVLNGIRVQYQSQPWRFNVTAWRYAFVKAVGGFTEPNAFYGGLESAMCEKAKRAGRRHCYLPDYRDDDRLMALHDPIYVQYKWDHAHHKNFSGSFEEYVKAKA